MSIFQNLIEIIEKKGSAYIVLIDPDKKNNDKIEDIVEKNLNLAQESAAKTIMEVEEALGIN